MRKIFQVVALVVFCSSFAFAQDVSQKVDAVMALMNEQSPTLQEISDKLQKNRGELEERAVVLKYHRGNKEVSDATNASIQVIRDYNDQAKNTLMNYQSTWFNQMENLMAIYTRYGELKEASGGGTTDLDAFVDAHKQYLGLMKQVSEDIEYIYTDCDYLKQ